MAHALLIGLFAWLGCVLGAAAGWVTGKVEYDLDRNGKSRLHYGAGAAAGLAAGFSLATWLGPVGWLGVLAAAPAAWILKKLARLVETAPEFRDSESRPNDPHGTERFTSGAFAVCSATGCSVVASCAAHYFGALGGLLSVTAGLVIVPYMATGAACLTMVIFASTIAVGLPRLGRRLTAVGARISAAIAGRPNS